MLRVIEAACQGSGVIRDEVVWRPEQDPASYDSVRRPSREPATSRSVEDIPLAELRAAARQLLAQSLSMKEAELQRAIGRVFGFQRIGATVAKRAQEAIESLVASGVARRDGESTVTWVG